MEVLIIGVIVVLFVMASRQQPAAPAPAQQPQTQIFLGPPIDLPSIQPAVAQPTAVDVPIPMGILQQPNILRNPDTIPGAWPGLNPAPTTAPVIATTGATVPIAQPVFVPLAPAAQAAKTQADVQTHLQLFPSAGGGGGVGGYPTEHIEEIF